jgi:hypothetical protein
MISSANLTQHTLLCSYPLAFALDLAGAESPLDKCQREVRDQEPLPRSRASYRASLTLASRSDSRDNSVFLTRIVGLVEWVGGQRSILDVLSSPQR